MCDFKPFDLVECIDSDPVHPESKSMPELGHLYHVAGVRRVGGGFSVRLCEITPECCRGGHCACGNCGWDSARFRRRDRPEERLAVFRTMLKQAERRPVYTDICDRLTNALHR